MLAKYADKCLRTKGRPRLRYRTANTPDILPLTYKWLVIGNYGLYEQIYQHETLLHSKVDHYFELLVLVPGPLKFGLASSFPSKGAEPQSLTRLINAFLLDVYAHEFLICQNERPVTDEVCFGKGFPP